MSMGLAPRMFHGIAILVPTYTCDGDLCANVTSDMRAFTWRWRAGQIDTAKLLCTQCTGKYPDFTETRSTQVMVLSGLSEWARRRA